jgi:hypothetical protein
MTLRAATSLGLVACAAVLASWACSLVRVAERVCPKRHERDCDCVRRNYVSIDGDEVECLPTRSGRVHAQREVEA